MPDLLHDVIFDYTLRNVALGSALLGIVGGVLGTFAVLRRQGLLGDALAHAALPGIVLAFMLTGSKASIRRIQVLRNGNQDITARVTDGSYVAKDVNPGAEVYLWVRVTVKTSAVPGRVNYIAISGQSTRMPRIKDVARLRTTVR